MNVYTITLERISAGERSPSMVTRQASEAAAPTVSGNGIARLFLTIASAFAEFERDRIGEWIRATKRAQKARGEFLGGVPPYGFAFDAGKNLVPIHDQQLALRRIRRLAAAGSSPRKISADLAERGVKLSHMTVRKILGRSAALA